MGADPRALPPRQRGQSMSEFIVVMPVLLLLLLGAIQFGLLYHAKGTLNLAAFEAARAGALNQGNPAAMQLGLANGLRPLFTYSTDHGQVISGFDTANEEVKTFARIEVVNPDAATVSAWKGRIPNGNLLYAKGTTPTGLTLQDANILKIKVTYCATLDVALLRTVIITAARDDSDPFLKNCYDADRLPLVAQGIVRMQSDYCPSC